MTIVDLFGDLHFGTQRQSERLSAAFNHALSKFNKSDILELFNVATNLSTTKSTNLDLLFTLTKLHNAKMGFRAVRVSVVINEFILLCYGILAEALGYQAASLADTAVDIHPTHLKTQAGSRLKSIEYETKVNQTAQRERS